MKKWMNIDNPFFEWMGNLADLVLLNLVFLVTCIPVITIGTANTALYRIILRRNRHETKSVVREYLEAFRQEWKQSFRCWLIFLLVGILLVFDVLYLGNEWSILGVGIGILCFIWMILFSYVFPVMSRFENSISGTLKFACFLAVRNLPYTLLIVAINVFPILCFVLGNVLLDFMVPIFLVIGFALMVDVNSFFFRRIFRPYIPEEEKSDRTEEVEE